MSKEQLPPPQRIRKHRAAETGDIFRLWQIPFVDDLEPARAVPALRERIKELNCLYGIGQLAERHADSIEHLLRDVAEFLPHSWQHSKIAGARIVFKGATYESKGFCQSQWRQSSRIFMYNEPVGEVMIVYLKECPPEDEGPFLREERVLLDAVAEQLGSIAMRISAELELQQTNQQLLMEQKALKEANTALRTVLSRIEEEKKEIYMDVQANVDKILIPILHEMTLHLPEPQRKYAELLRTSMEDIASPFVSQLSKNFLSLTATEVAVCNMIRNGLQTKEIARIRGVSPGTINRHREHIRKKLGIANNDINLRTYLQSNMGG